MRQISSKHISMKLSFDIKNDKEFCHFIIGPSKIGHNEFKNDCPETPGLILKDQGPKNW